MNKEGFLAFNPDDFQYQLTRRASIPYTYGAAGEVNFHRTPIRFARICTVTMPD
jgi:hypothetical protein